MAKRARPFNGKQYQNYWDFYKQVSVATVNPDDIFTDEPAALREKARALAIMHPFGLTVGGGVTMPYDDLKPGRINQAYKETYHRAMQRVPEFEQLVKAGIQADARKRGITMTDEDLEERVCIVLEGCTAAELDSWVGEA